MAKLPRFAQKASLVKTLVSFDGPQVALLESDRNIKMLAVACLKKGFVYPFFAAEVSTKTLNKYLEQRIDLNYAISIKEAHKRYYFFDWKKMQNLSFPLVRANESEIEDQDYYPEPGFFARDHTEKYEISRLLKSTERIFNIDGKWDASDFSRFYSKIADIYALALLNTEAVRKKISTLDLAVTKEAINNYAWAGGASYVSFYNNLFETVKALNPLNIARIKYASPGTIELEGGKEALEEISTIMRRFESNGEEIYELQKQIGKLLDDENLRGAHRDDQFSSKRIEDFAFKRVNALAELLGFENPEDIYSLCSSNTLVYTKVILSYYRRGRDLHKFYAEGRVKSE